MTYSVSIESGVLNQQLADRILARFLPTAYLTIINEPWFNDPRFDDENGWYSDNQYTEQHNQLTRLVLDYIGDTDNTTETYVFITHDL